MQFRQLFVHAGVSAAFVLVALSSARGADAANSVVEIPFHGEIHAQTDISGIAKFSEFLIVGGDEPTDDDAKQNLVQVLSPSSSGGYGVHATITLLAGGEFDLEDIAVTGRSVYVIGSHSAKRKKVNESNVGDTLAKNRQALEKVTLADEADDRRDAVLQFELKDDGTLDGEVRQISLRETIHTQPILRLFESIPGKENGVDIEGLAVKDGWLYVGFRGPVLRENHVPILRFRFADSLAEQQPELLFVNLGGHGIRGMTATSDGFLLLAGPVGGADEAARLYYWDGHDCLPGTDRPDGEPRGRCIELNGLPAVKGATAEGITLADETENEFKVYVVFDGAANGGCRAVSVPKR